MDVLRETIFPTESAVDPTAPIKTYPSDWRLANMFGQFRKHSQFTDAQITKIIGILRPRTKTLVRAMQSTDTKKQPTIERATWLATGVDRKEETAVVMYVGQFPAKYLNPARRS